MWGQIWRFNMWEQSVMGDCAEMHYWKCSVIDLKV